MTNFEIMKGFYGRNLSIETAVRVLSEEHPCCCFCSKEKEQKTCRMECEEGVREWLESEVEEDD